VASHIQGCEHILVAPQNENRLRQASHKLFRLRAWRACDHRDEDGKCIRVIGCTIVVELSQAS
jgi:hypothetical protein